MRPITTSVYTFANLIEGGFVYVDKTAYLRELVRPAFAQYFLSRPRRFGKSLAISTLQAIFEGRRELFKGLAIDSSDYDWKTYPVMRLDMGSCQAETVEGLRLKLLELLSNEAVRNGIAVEPSPDPSILFTRLIISLAAKSPQKKMVLLLDEYDKPLLGHLGTPEVTKFKNALKEFYSVIKTQEGYQRFAFMTGVSKFSKVSIFSDLNNLTDITMDARYATLFGYTREEVLANFPDHIAALAEANGLTPQEAFAKMEELYDGFKFEENAERVFNPVSVGKCLTLKKFDNYWFETGTPTFLIDLLKRNPVRKWCLNYSVGDFNFVDADRIFSEMALIQAGYFSIAKSWREQYTTVLEFAPPNRETYEALQKLGCAFDWEKRNLGQWLIAEKTCNFAEACS